MRKHNFNPGPGALPVSVLAEAARQLPDHDGLGLSILEMSHRSKEFEAVHFGARDAIAALYGLPDTHEVLFLQGGASLQFAMVPMNLGAGGAYVTTGAWSEKALGEAKTLGAAHEIWTDQANNFRNVPAKDARLEVPAGATYLHYTSNNTIFGTQWHHVPQSAAPLVCDMSSDFLSKPLDLGAFDLVYAGAQKNAGPSGVTIVVGKKDVLRGFKGAATVPAILRYDTHAKNDSLYNTPPTLGIYLVGLVAKWAQAQGGLAQIQATNTAKAKLLYDVIDGRPDFYKGHASPASRSHMNVTFTLVNADHEKALLAAADKRGILGLKGHRSVGGLRASIYNAVPTESVAALASLLAEFNG